MLGTDAMGVTPKFNTIEVNAPKNLSNGTPITSYTYKIKETNGTGDYKSVPNSTPASNEFIYTSLAPETSYSILVEGIDKDNNKETVLNTEVSTATNNLAKYITNYVPTVTSGPGLYHHTADLPGSAEDNNYRYAGADPDNYVCIGSNANPCPEDNQYRIIGVFDGKVKVIKVTSIGDYAWNEETNKYILTWSDGYNNKWEWSGYGTGKAYLNTYLNGEWLTTLENAIGTDKIAEVTWQIGGMRLSNFQNKIVPEVYKLELNSTSKTTYPNEEYVDSIPTKIGLMYVSDYGYAAIPESWNHKLSYQSDGTGYNDGIIEGKGNIKDNDWMFTSDFPWTISRLSDSSNNVLCVDSSGRVDSEGYVYNRFADTSSSVHPVFYLESNVMISGGDGTYDNSFILG